MGSRRILTADDEANIRVSLGYLMRREGSDVVLAQDGQAALDAISHEQPDLVLLDVMMPKMTGFEVCQAIRHNARLRDTPVLFESALGACAAEGASAATGEKPVSHGTTSCAQGPTLGFSVSPRDPRFSPVSLRCLLPHRLLAHEADVINGLALGANAYMAKPFDRQAPIVKVHELLGDPA